VKHVVVTDADRRVVGILSIKDVLTLVLVAAAEQPVAR
jgi:CBS domain-containing protein